MGFNFERQLYDSNERWLPSAYLRILDDALGHFELCDFFLEMENYPLIFYRLISAALEYNFISRSQRCFHKLVKNYRIGNYLL